MYISAGGLFVLEGIIRPVGSVSVPVYISAGGLLSSRVSSAQQSVFRYLYYMSAGGLFVLEGIIRPVVSVLVPVYISLVIFNIEIYSS